MKASAKIIGAKAPTSPLVSATVPGDTKVSFFILDLSFMYRNRVTMQFQKSGYICKCLLALRPGHTSL
jgi:hypothetical protein